MNEPTPAREKLEVQLRATGERFWEDRGQIAYWTPYGSIVAWLITFKRFEKQSTELRFDPQHEYTLDEIKAKIQAARDALNRLMPDIDLPLTL